MDLETVLVYAFIFFLGIIIGSFLNVCILRIPKGESIVTERSHCNNCKKILKWWELVPVFSWLFLRGKCSKCKTSISFIYPFVELLNAVLWMLVFYVHGFTLYTLFSALITSVLIVISFIDAKTKEIPIGTTISIGILALIYTVIDYQNLLDHVLGFVSVAVLLLIVLILSKGKSIGGGDVKLMAASGLYLGLFGNVVAFVLGCIIGSLVHIIRMIFFKAGRELAFGPYLAVGIFISILWGDYLVSSYLNMVGFA